MYAEGRPFAELYFGNKEEAAEERRLVLGDSKLVQGVAGSPATDVSKSLDSTGAHSIIHFRFVARDDETNAPVDLLSNPYDRTGDRKLRVLKEVVLDGSAIGRAGLQPGKNGKTEISFFWSDSGRRSFAEVTAANVGRQLAIVYDNEVLTAPRINEAIDGGIGKITGDFQDAEAERIVRSARDAAVS
jgi:preprotein translocase subunit SecD